jgi:hypothetical protein
MMAAYGGILRPRQLGCVFAGPILAGRRNVVGVTGPFCRGELVEVPLSKQS